MKFKLLLFILLKKMQWAAKKNQAFKKFIKNKQLSLCIKTKDNKNGREFVFNNGKITSRSGIAQAPAMSMVWCDANTGFKTMSSPNEEAPVAALTEQKLVIDGSFKEFAWFSRSLDIMMGKA